LREVSSSKETEGIEDEIRPLETFNSARKQRKESFQEKNKVTGIPASDTRSRKTSNINIQEESKAQ
jgi:hypothetical protein